MTVERPLPHLVLIMTDQHRAGFTAGTGFGLDTMPTLDRLGAAGTTFDCAYTSYPACVPARTSLLTGRFPSAHRVRQNSNADQASYETDLLDVLRERGYRLQFAGKPHMHPGPEDFDGYAGPYWHQRGPERSAEHQRFDAWLDDLDHGVASEPTPFGLESQLPYRIVSDALALLAEPSPDPTFTWVSFPEPHNPYQVPEPYFSRFAEREVPDRLAGPEVIDRLGWRYRWLRDLQQEKRPGYDDDWRRYRANYLGMLALIDDQIARLVAALEERAEDTVIIFVSDHGDYVGDYGLQRKGAGMSDALLRIPLQISGPGITGGQRRSEPVSIVDLMPTLCELLGADIPAGVQGRSLLPLLRGEPAPAEEFGSVYAELGYGGLSYRVQDRPELHFPYEGATFDELNSVTQSGAERMVRSGPYKLIIDDRSDGRLYDLQTDPAEVDNRYDDPEYAGHRDRLHRLLLRWLLRTTDDLPTGAYRPRTAPHNWRWAGPEPSGTATTATTTSIRGAR